MNISKTPTTHLLVRAYTNSEWDSCDFALITLTEQWLEKVKKVAQQVSTLKSDPDFVNLSFYEARTDFYTLSDEEQPDLSFLEERTWAFVELTEEELASFNTPESRLDIYRSVFTRYDDFYIKAYGKYSSDEYWTDDIRFDELFKTFGIDEEAPFDNSVTNTDLIEDFKVALDIDNIGEAKRIFKLIKSSYYRSTMETILIDYFNK